MRLRHSLCVVITAAIAATAGCGGEDQTPATPAIDVSKLDSGNYPVTPRDIEAIRVTRTGAALESVRIGSSSPLPFDIDGRYAFQRLVNTDRRTTPEAPSVAESLSEEEWSDLTKGFVAGWQISG